MQDSKKDTDVYSRLLDSEGEGGMIWENGIETCILSCKNHQSMFDAGYKLLGAGVQG